MFRQLIIAAILATAAILVWIGTPSAEAVAQDSCPTPGQNISPISEFDLLSVTGSNPTASAQQSIDVTGRDGQQLMLTFTFDQQKQNANDTLESVIGEVTLGGEVMFTNTILHEGPALNETLTRSWIVPSGATHVTLQANLTITNDPPNSYTSGSLYLRVNNISLVTPDTPCETEMPDAPSWLAVCGVVGESDVTVPAPPENVLIDSSGWSEAGIWTVMYSPEYGYALPDGFQRMYTFTHPGLCETDSPNPPAQSAVCGPDNDAVSISDQPAGVVLESDSLWQINSRVITFTMEPGFTTSGKLSFTLKDEAISCPVEEIGKQVTIIFDTSDSGSIEGTSYALYTPIASQTGASPFAEGVIGPNNSVVFDGLIAGEYRLTASPAGYEPVDTTFSVKDDSDPQEVLVSVTAIQIPPTQVPTSEPTVVPTAIADQPVVALPNTGTGSGGNAGLFVVVGIASVALCITILGVGRFGPPTHR